MKYTFNGHISSVNPTPNPVSVLIRLNTLIAEFTRSNRNLNALQIFHKIQSTHHLKPDHYTLSSSLTACANLSDKNTGEQIHSVVIHNGFRGYIHVDNSLLSLYTKARDFISARKLFDEIPSPDIFSWTTILSAYMKSGQIDSALYLFDQAPRQDVSVWNSIITGFIDQDFLEIAFHVFILMRRMGVQEDRYSLASILRLCCVQELFDLGEGIHSLIIKTGFLLITSVTNALLTLYLSCGAIVSAYQLFDENKECNTVTFNAMISGLLRCGKDIEALKMFVEMRQVCSEATELTFASVFGASSSRCLLKMGNQVHGLSIKMGFEDCTLVSNAMIGMYANCGDLLNAELVFKSLQAKDLISWNSIIAGYAERDLSDCALKAYMEMQGDGFHPDEFTIGSLLSCSESKKMTQMIHAVVIKNALASKTAASNALISAYSNHNDMENAHKIFTEMLRPNLISWNSILSGCLLNGCPLMGFEMSSKLLKSDVKPNHYTLNIVLSICASISDLRHGKQIHSYVVRFGLESEISLANVLIALYAKCGELELSCRIFKRMLDRDIVSWNSMISAYAQHGKGREAISCFDSMQELGFKPDEVTFTIVLSACSRGGLVEEGHQIFNLMAETYQIQPTDGHYCCLVDLLARAGYLDEAEELIKNTPHKTDPNIWWALLSACKAHGSVRLGRIAFGSLIEFKQENPALYVLLSSINAAEKRWDEAASLRDLMRKKGLVKKPGYSWIDS